MNKASPKVRIEDMGRANVAAAEAAPVAADFTNFWTDYARAGGIMTPSDITKSSIPYWQQYEKGRASFNITLDSGTFATATITLFGMSPDETIRVIGRQDITDIYAEPIEFDISSGEVYAVRVTALGVAGTPVIDVDVDMQGFFAYRH